MRHAVQRRQIKKFIMAYRLVQIFKHLLENISVEPIIILNNLSMSMFLVAQQVGMYRVMCEQVVNDKGRPTIADVNRSSSANIDCWSSNLGSDIDANTSSWSKIEIQLQEMTASWSMIFSLAYTVPCIFADIFMGAYSDEQGRKYNILIGVVGIIVSMIPWAILFSWPSTIPLFIIVIGDVLGGMTGFFAIIPISAGAYVADTVTDSRTLTLRMTIVVICSGAADIFGPLIAKGLLGVVSFSGTVVVTIGFQVLTFIAALLILKQVPPKEMRKRAQMKADGVDKGEIQRRCELEKKSHREKRKCADKLRSACSASICLMKAVWRTFTRKRQGHRRIYILILSTAVFLGAVAQAITSGLIVTLFVQKAPLRWNQNDITDYKSTAFAASLIGSTAGIFLFKNYFQFSDTLIIIVALISTCLRCLMTAFSDRAWLLYVAAGLGLLQPLLLPCVQSFVAKIVDADEVGKSYIAFSIGTNLASFANMMIFTAIYRATVAYFAGFVYVLCAILILITLCLAVWVHMDFHDCFLRLYLKRKVIDLKL